MKIRKVSASLLDSIARPNVSRRPLSAREQRRLEMERSLGLAIKRADRDSSAAFRLDLEEGDKTATVRLAFGRVRQRLAATEVNLFARDGVLVVAKRPQTSGRRAKG